VWKRKCADDLHIGTLVSFTVGVTLWLIYGIAVRQMPVVVANAVTLALQCMILFLKLRYARARKRAAAASEKAGTQGRRISNSEQFE
jgi:MtN3 and saliva related transmembrane protein